MKFFVGFYVRIVNKCGCYVVVCVLCLLLWDNLVTPPVASKSIRMYIIIPLYTGHGYDCTEWRSIRECASSTHYTMNTIDIRN